MKPLYALILALLLFSCKKEEPQVPSVVVDNEIFKVVEDMPSFPGCEGISDKTEKKECSDEKMLAFIHENLEYPPKAKLFWLEGMAVVKFVIEKDGSISNGEIVRDIGLGCGQEALRVIMAMPDWEPGKQRGIPVRVQYNLPIRFEL